MFSAGFQGWRKSTLSIRRSGGRKSKGCVRALRCREVYILNHHRLGSRVQVDHGNGLLGFVGVFAELDSIPAVDDQKIAALAAMSESIRTAKHRHGHGSDSRQMRRRINHQRAGWRDGPSLSSTLLLAPCGDRKSVV